MFFYSVFSKYLCSLGKVIVHNTVYLYDWKIKKFRQEQCMWSLATRFGKSIWMFLPFSSESKTSYLRIWQKKLKKLSYIFIPKVIWVLNKTFSKWTNTLHGVLQGSILGPMLFNVFLCDLFPFINTGLVSYADDNTQFAMGRSELEVINEIKSVTESLSL